MIILVEIGVLANIFHGIKNAFICFTMRPCNENIQTARELARQLMLLADKGDMDRDDDSCGVLYGIIRDAAYQISKRAEEERDKHKINNKWNEEITVENRI
jgi:hypothetical protein